MMRGMDGDRDDNDTSELKLGSDSVSVAEVNTLIGPHV